MHLTPGELDRLLTFGVAELARRRLARGLRLNVPEATALVADTVCEAARDGLRLSAAIEAGRSALRADQVLPGVADVVTEVAVEAVFDDGSRLAVVSQPFGPAGAGPLTPGRVEPAALRPAPTGPVQVVDTEAVDTEVGSTEVGSTKVGSTEAGSTEVVDIEVVNTATVPITVTSHFHFFEANPRLRFDRARAYGRHLAVPSGSHVRFDPGVPQTVGLAPIAGRRVVIGFAGLVDGPLDAPGAAEAALARAHACGYLDAARPAPA